MPTVASAVHALTDADNRPLVYRTVDQEDEEWVGGLGVVWCSDTSNR